MNRIAVIRIAGEHGLTVDVKTTLKLLNLHKKYTCSIIPNQPTSIGMLKKIKDYVTWGELDSKTFKTLLITRGRLPGNKKLTEDYITETLKISTDEFVEKFMVKEKEIKEIPGLKPFFRLSPPIKGFERKGVKKPFSTGGVLGYRKEKINALLERMI